MTWRSLGVAPTGGVDWNGVIKSDRPADPATIWAAHGGWSEWIARYERQGKSVEATWFPVLLEISENKNVVELGSGLRYEILKTGDGTFPKASDTVKVHYHGTLVDGTVFDSSVQRGEPTEFPLGGVIPGWTEGLQKVSKGGKIKLYVPSHLAYGDTPPQGSPITPGATLVFEVDLLEIKGGAAMPAPAPGK